MCDCDNQCEFDLGNMWAAQAAYEAEMNALADAEAEAQLQMSEAHRKGGE